jgi:hypothetical protein
VGATVLAAEWPRGEEAGGISSMNESVKRFVLMISLLAVWDRVASIDSFWHACARLTEAVARHWGLGS